LKYKLFVKIREQVQNESINSRPDPIWYECSDKEIIRRCRRLAA